MNDIEKEIEKIRYELSVSIPEELQNTAYSGDILDSSEYSEIISRQHLLSVRLLHLDKRLHMIKSIDTKTIPRHQVGLGSLVTLVCKHTEFERKVKLIASEMFDEFPEHEEITMNSPMGKVLCNKSVNDEINVYTPSGIKEYRITGLITIHDIKTPLDKLK